MGPQTLPQVGPEVREQAVKLLDENSVEQTVVALNTLGEEYQRRLRYHNSKKILASFFSMLVRGPIGIDKSTLEILKEERLQSAKIALGRLAGMLEYAANDLDELEDASDVFYRKHYNPRKVDRTKVFDLLAELQGQLAAIPDETIKNRLIADVEKLKEEVKRPNPRWRDFLGKTIIVLAILADVKTMHPEIGNDILQTVDAVVRTVVSECQPTLEKPPALPQDGPKHWAMQTKLIEFKEDGEWSEE